MFSSPVVYVCRSVFIGVRVFAGVCVLCRRVCGCVCVGVHVIVESAFVVDV